MLTHPCGVKLSVGTFLDFSNDDFTLATADGDIFYNSVTDYNSLLAPFGWNLVIALCLPNADYTFTYNSAEGNGFGDDESAFLVIIRSNEEIAVVQGDFGDDQ